jgi:ABC-type amino acid transport substrate-binding protein
MIQNNQNRALQHPYTSSRGFNKLCRAVYMIGLLCFSLMTAADTPSVAQSSSTDQSGVLKVACFNYPPFAYFDEKTQKTTGFTVELERRIWESQGYQLNVELMPLVRAIHQVVHNQADIMCAYVPNVTAEVKLFPLPIGTLTYYAWVPASENDWHYQGLDSLVGRDLLTIRSLYYSGSLSGFRQHLAKHPAKLELSGQHPAAQAIKIMRSGRANTLIMDKDLIAFYQKTLHMEQTLKTAGVVGVPTYIYPAAATHNPAYDELQTSFLLGLLRLRESGELEALRKEFGISDWGDRGHLNSLQQQPASGVRAPMPSTN